MQGKDIKQMFILNYIAQVKRERKSKLRMNRNIIGQLKINVCSRMLNFYANKIY